MVKRKAETDSEEKPKKGKKSANNTANEEKPKKVKKLPNNTVNEEKPKKVKKLAINSVNDEKPKKTKKSANNTVNEAYEGNNETKSDSLKNKKEKRGKYEKSLGKNFDKQNSSQDGQTEKPNWVEIKKKKKELKEKYKVEKLHKVYDISVQVKKIGEKLRRSDRKPEERKRLISQAHNLLQTHYNKIILTHDMSRIVQWIIKYCEQNIRQAIINELKPSLLSMIGSKYAKNCVKNMLKHGTKENRQDIISVCYGNVVKFISHSVSAPLLELMYSTWATETEKAYFKQEFYGDMYKQAKDKDIKSLPDVYKTAVDMKSATLSAVKGNLTRILNKKLVNFTLVQSVLLEFLDHCSVEDRNEMIVTLRNSIVELSETKTGTKIALVCIWHGTNKDRKIIMKVLKENVKTVSMSEHGYFILLALFDSVDDTVLMKKIILSEIQKDLTDIALNEYGKHVILYLIARRNSHYFPPNIVTFLKQGDNNEFSKKPADIRAKELLDSIIDSLLEAVSTNVATWMFNSSIAMVTLAVLKVGTGEKLKTAFESVAGFVTDINATIEEGGVKLKPFEHAGLHMVLKKLIQNDKELQTKNESTFGEVLLDHLTTNVIEQWIECNRACFLLILLLENETKSTVKTLLSKLKPVVNILKSKSNPGATILLSKFKNSKPSKNKSISEM